MKTKQIYVTVGTTSFDELIRTIDSSEFENLMLDLGYNRIILQIGRGTVIPNFLQSSERIHASFYRYNPEYSADIRESSLVISHAGAGSIMDSLSCDKPLVVVVNENLMDNHQVELAKALEDRNILISSTCSELIKRIQDSEFEKLVPYPKVNNHAFPHLINSEVGFQQ